MHPWLCDRRVSEWLVCEAFPTIDLVPRNIPVSPGGLCRLGGGESLRHGFGSRAVWVPNRCSSLHSLTGAGEGLAGETGGVGVWVRDGCNPACSLTGRTSGVGVCDCSLLLCCAGLSSSAATPPPPPHPVPSRVDADLETFVHVFDDQLGDGGIVMLPSVAECIESVGLNDFGVSRASTPFVLYTVSSGCHLFDVSPTHM